VAAIVIIVSEVFIRAPSSEELRVANEQLMEKRAKSQLDDADGGRSVMGQERGQSPTNDDDAFLLYSPSSLWLVKLLRATAIAIVVVLSFSFARESVDALSCHPRTGRDLVRYSAGDIEISQFSIDDSTQGTAPVVSVSNSTNATLDMPTLVAGDISGYLSILEREAPAGCRP